MSDATVRSGFDTWVGSSRPSVNHAKDKYLYLDASGGAARSLIYFKVPAPRGATILSATLRVFARGASTGSRTLTAKRVTQSWKVSTTTFNNAPSVTATGQASTVIGTVANADPIDFDVTEIVQTLVNGTANYGFEISTSTTTPHSIFSMEAPTSGKPYLVVEWSDAPAEPTTLTPSDGTVSVAKPIVQCDYTDGTGNTSLSAIQVQIDPTADGGSPDFDSGTVPTTSPELNLASTAFAGLTSGVAQQWRVRVQDGAGLWSEWSDWTAIVYLAKGTVTIDNPTGGFVYETTPPILWTFADQTAYQVLIFDAENPLRPLHDSGKRTGTDDAYSIPAKVLVDDRTFLVEVRCWDNVEDRVATPGHPTYAATTASFVVDVDDEVDPIATLLVEADGITPGLALEWTRSTAPDSWTVYEDDVPVTANLDPADVFVSGTTYRYVYYSARPNHDHTYAVRAVVNGAMSPDGPTDVGHISPAGIWLIDPDDGLSVTLWGDDEGTWNMADDASVYRPINSKDVVRIVSGMSGLDGSLQGVLMEGFGKTFAEQEADFYALKSRSTSRLRLVASDLNIEVLVGNLRLAPRPITRDGRIVKAASFDFWQVGDLPFDPNV